MFPGDLYSEELLVLEVRRELIKSVLIISRRH